MIDWLKGLKERPWIAHLLRANERFGGRMGNQFGAAITYFSVLALVPLIMVAFSITGFVLVELRPQLLDQLEAYLTDKLGQSAQTTQLLELINRFLRDYTSVGIVGLVSALYSGAGWMGNLRDAIRAQWRTDFDGEQVKENIVAKTVLNLLRLLGLIVAMGITFGLAALSTSLSGVVVSALQLDDVTWLSPVLRIVPIVVSVAAGWVLFMYLFTVLPDDRAPWPAVRRGSLLGSVGLVVLQYLTTFLVGMFSGNAAAAVFGPVIVLMLFFNIFARLILFVAAWIATTDEPAFPSEEAEEKVRFALQPLEAHTEPEPVMVRQEVAAKSVRVGLGAGYATGTATGVGLGALVALAVARVTRRRDRD
ncbi:MAG: YhjD/YihY/BrkB family envelope integrity protein [Propionibacteriaceae bacterium]